MKNVRDLLSTIVQYYGRHRGVGHSRAQQRGTELSDCLVLCPRSDFARMTYAKKGIAFDSLPLALYGTDKPLVIEHDAIRQLMLAAIARIDELEEENDNLKAQLDRNLVLGRT